MGWFTSFFKFLWGMIKDTFAFIGSIYSQLVVAFTTIVSAVVGVKTSLSEGSSYVQGLNTMVSSGVGSVASFFTNQHDSMHVCLYTLSIDVVANATLSLATISLSVLVVLVTFLVVSIPLYLFSIYFVKATAWVVVSVIPSGWCPQGLLRLTRIKSNLAKSVFDGFVKVFKDMPLW